MNLEEKKLLKHFIYIVPNTTHNKISNRFPNNKNLKEKQTDNDVLLTSSYTQSIIEAMCPR